MPELENRRQGTEIILFKKKKKKLNRLVMPTLRNNFFSLLIALIFLIKTTLKGSTGRAGKTRKRNGC